MRLQVTQVEPDMAAAYQDVIKNEVIPALKKAGQSGSGCLRRRISQGGTLVTVRPIANYAEFDQPGMLKKRWAGWCREGCREKSRRRFLAMIRGYRLSIPI